MSDFAVVGFYRWNPLSAHCTYQDVNPEEESERAKRLLGERISRRRMKIGLSQENLARLARVNRSHMSDIETGKTEPGVWTVIRIAGVLGTTSSQLLRGLKWTPADRVSDYLKDAKD